MKEVKNIDEYISKHPEEIRLILEEIRKVIKQAAPEAVETISYAMPAFKQNGILCYFAAFKSHIGFYALPDGNEAFKKELSPYKTGKGSIRFPLSKPIPYGLIATIVQFRVKENEIKAHLKKENSKKKHK